MNNIEKYLDSIYYRGTDLWPVLHGSNILILGDTGFYGKWFVAFFEYLNKKGYNINIKGLSRKDGFDIETFGRMADTIKKFTPFITKANFVINACGDSTLNKENHETLQVHGFGPIRLFNHIIEKTIGLQISSGAADMCVTAYGKSKRISELALSFNPNVKIVRAYNTIGPGMDLNKNFAISTFIKNALENKPLEVTSFPIVRSFCFVSDIIIQMLHVMIQGDNKEPYDVGSDNSISILDAAKLISENIITVDKNFETRSNSRFYFAEDVDITLQEFDLDIDFDSKKSIIETYNWFKNNAV